MSIKEIANLLLNATSPEEVFGGNTEEEVIAEYQRLLDICNPDKVKFIEQDLAKKTTKILEQFYEEAITKLDNDFYNVTDIKQAYKNRIPLFTFEYNGKKYDIYSLIKEEDVGIIYEGIENDELIRLKIAGLEDDNSLILNEYNILKKYSHLGLPTIISKLKINGREALIMKKEEGLEMTEIKRMYGAIPEEHIAWILERLLSLIGFLHSNKIVHGNIKPENIIIDVDNHNVKLMDYTLSIINANEEKSRYKIINEDYTPSYVSANKRVEPNVDIYAIGKIAIKLMGGDTKRSAIPTDISDEFRTFVRKLINDHENDAFKLWDELIELRNKLYGQNRFQKLEKKLK